MLKNYFKIAVRNILKNKIYSFINIIGLAVGISACILIVLYVINEESFDSFNRNADRIVRATMTFSFSGVSQNVAVTGTKLLPAFKRNFPEIEDGVRLYPSRAIVKYKDKLFEEPDFVYADSTFFKVFSFKMIEGNPGQVLTKPNSVILTSSSARKYFGNKDAIGKVIRINTRDLASVSWNDYTVTGIVQDCPLNSQIKFDFLASFCSLRSAKPGKEIWWNADYFTYFLLKTPEAIKTLKAKIPAYMKAQNKELGLSGNNFMTIHLEPLTRVHLYSEAQGGFIPPGDYRYIIIFSLVALLILLIACANYVNITTAKATERAKEIGVRKVIGAVRGQLFYQFIAESFIIVTIAFLIGIVFAEFILPVFKNIYGVNLGLSALLSSNAIGAVLFIILLIGLLGASYPAFLLSKYKPIKVLKGNFKTGSSGVWIRKSLIVFQFVISVVLIICTLIIKDQLNYINNKKLGFDKNHIVVFTVDETMAGKVGVLKNEFLKSSNITGVTFATRTPVFINSTNNIVYDNRKIMVNQLGVDQDFLKTLGVKLIAGNNFTPADTAASSKDNSNEGLPILVNEAALGQLNLTAEKAVGTTVFYKGQKCLIKGVIKDFHFSSMRSSINPLVLFINGYLNKMMVKVSGGSISNTIHFMKEKWSGLFPEHPFNMTFLNDDFNKLYQSENRTEKIFYIFGILAVVLAYLGLFGLISYSIQQRTKEIGIRKTLGATTSNIIGLLSKSYIKYILLANIIACPLALYAVKKWLEGFAYRTEISVWIFLAVMLLTFALVIAMIGLQSVKAAKINPVESLRYE
jgi:putative ABC transport system permease protein